MRAWAAIATVSVLAGCGGASQSLANAPEFDFAARSFGNPAEADSFGQSVGFTPGGVAVGAPGENGGASDAGQVHLFDPATGEVRRTLQSPRPVPDGAFGAAIAIVGSDLLVGAPGEGRVYRFDENGAQLAVYEGPRDEEFGAAVVVFDGLVVIGAPRRAVGQGAVYFREFASGADRGRLPSPTPAFSGAFGSALAAVGGDLLVGAPGEHGGAGAVHLLAAPSGQVRVTIRGPGGRLGDAFGEAVAGAAGDLLVGAPGEGMAYLFAANGSLRHVLFNPEDGALFGLAVAYADGHLMVAALQDRGATVYLFSAISGAFERRVTVGDGVAGAVALTAQGGLALVGTPAGGDARRGLATTMNCDTGIIEQEFESPDPGPFNAFGGEVTILSNGRMAVSEGDDAGDDGQVHVYEPDGMFVTTFLPPTAGTGGEFGSDLAALGTLVVIGERSANGGDGAVHVADPDTEMITLTILPPDGPGSGGEFGEAVAVVDGKILVGEPFGGDGEVFPGKAYAFDTSGNLVHTIEDPDSFDGGEFGASVNGAGTDYLVGSPFNRIVYCFDGTTGLEKQSYLPDILTGTTGDEDLFGAAVAGNEQEVWVGAPDASVFDPQAETELFAAGRVYVFNKNSGARLDLLESPRPTENGLFGDEISIDGGLVAVSACGESSDLDSQLQGGMGSLIDGLVYVYDRARRFTLARVASPNGVSDGGFGDDVQIVDGVLAIGASGEPAGLNTQAGKAYTFDTEAFGPTFSDFPETNGAYGAAIDGIDDRRAIVGAPQQNGGNGDAYIMNTETNVAEFAMQNNTVGASGFGLAVVRLNNGLFAIGAPFDGGTGTVRICNGIGFEVAVIPNPGATTFGFSLAAVGANGLLVGAPALDQQAGTVETPGTAHLYDVDNSGTSVVVTPLQVVQSPVGDGLDDFGWSVAELGGDLLVGAPGENGTGAAYLFRSNDGTQAASFTAPTPVQGVRFGTAVGRVASLGGPNEALVGSPGEARVYRFQGNGTFAQTINDPDLNPVSGFGFALKGTLDFRMFVGAPNGLDGQGIGYELNGFGNLINEYESLNPVIGGLFGAAVSFLPLGTVPLFGAPNENVNPDGAGRAYRFGFRFQQQPPPPPPPPPVDDTVEFEAPNPTAGDGFGTAVAFSGTRVLVSAPCANNGSGEVYVYEGATAALLDTIPNPGTGADKFGCSLDANALMIVVGASDADQGASGSGASYLYSAETRSLLLTFDLDDPQIDGGHGKASSVDSANILVGEPFADVSTSLSGLGLPDAGRASIYDCRVTSVIVSLESPNPQALGLFGCCVHIDGSTVYVAACGESGAEGRVYCFDLLSGQLRVTILPPTAQAGQFFGTSCATINGNVIVGAPGFDDQQLAGQTSGDEGIVYVINPNTGAVVKTLRSGNPTGGGLFGTSVATNGSRIIVGAPGEARGDGRVYVFDAATCALLETLVPPSGVTGGAMGAAVAAMADNVLTGAPTANNTAGAAFLNPPKEDLDE